MRVLTLLLLLLSVSAHGAQLRQFGVATTVTFSLYNADGTLDIDEVDGGTEVTVHCDEDGGTTAGSDFVDEGSYYSIALTATEMECARVTLDVNATVREVVHLETYGSHAAQHLENTIRGEQAQAGAASSVTLDASASATDNFYNNAYVSIIAGTGSGQTRLITAYNGTSKVATVNRAWETNPASGSFFQVIHSDSPLVTVDTDGHVEANVVEISDDATAATNAEALFDNAGFNMSNSTLGTVSALAPGSVDASVIASNAIDADSLAADAGTEIWNVTCEPNGSRQCDQVLALLLAEAMGRCTAPSDGTSWTCNDPENTAQRFQITYGSDNGDRTNVSITAP